MIILPFTSMFFSSWLLPRLHDQGVGHFLEICGALKGHPVIPLFKKKKKHRD